MGGGGRGGRFHSVLEPLQVGVEGMVFPIVEDASRTNSLWDRECPTAPLNDEATPRIRLDIDDMEMKTRQTDMFG